MSARRQAIVYVFGLGALASMTVGAVLAQAGMAGLSIVAGTVASWFGAVVVNLLTSNDAGE